MILRCLLPWAIAIWYCLMMLLFVFVFVCVIHSYLSACSLSSVFAALWGNRRVCALLGVLQAQDGADCWTRSCPRPAQHHQPQLCSADTQQQIHGTLFMYNTVCSECILLIRYVIYFRIWMITSSFTRLHKSHLLFVLRAVSLLMISWRSCGVIIRCSHNHLNISK